MILSVSQRCCMVCGNTAYGCVWLEETPPNGVCPEGAKIPTDCWMAMSRAKLVADLLKEAQAFAMRGSDGASNHTAHPVADTLRGRS